MRFYEFAEVSVQGTDQVAQSSQAAPNTPTLVIANKPAVSTANVNLAYNIEFNEQVKVMQTKLEQIGYDVGPPGADGKYGPWTAAAVQAFKKDYQLGSNANNFSSQDMMKLDRVISGAVARVPTPTKPQLSVDMPHLLGHGVEGIRQVGEFAARPGNAHPAAEIATLHRTRSRHQGVQRLGQLAQQD